VLCPERQPKGIEICVGPSFSAVGYDPFRKEDQQVVWYKFSTQYFIRTGCNEYIVFLECQDHYAHKKQSNLQQILTINHLAEVINGGLLLGNIFWPNSSSPLFHVTITHQSVGPVPPLTTMKVHYSLAPIFVVCTNCIYSWVLRFVVSNITGNSHQWENWIMLDLIFVV
jgi:hypothetical protein